MLQGVLRDMIERILPMRLRRSVQSLWEFNCDRRQYIAHAGPDDRHVTADLTEQAREMQLTKDYHRIEKGLSLRSPKRPFGGSVAARIEMLLAGVDRGRPKMFERDAQTALEALHEWNSSGTINPDVAPVSSDYVPQFDQQAFFRSRHSVRDFASRPVESEAIHTAIGLALCSPSVCNRQAWRVHLFSGPDAKRALVFQNGNAAFAHSVPLVLVVSVDQSLFAGLNERNQVFVEGGIFASSLVWALHSLGLSSCMLNMSRSSGHLRRTATALDIAPSERIVMFIAVGYAEKGHRRTRSPRRPEGSILIDHGIHGPREGQ